MDETEESAGVESEGQKTQYVIQSDVRFAPLEQIDLDRLVADCDHPWFNQTLCRVNDCVVRFGVFEGEFHWHAHAGEDEFFYVVSGELTIEIEGRAPAVLRARQGITIPRGVRHRPVAPTQTVVLMIEGATIQPLGDAPAEAD